MTNQENIYDLCALIITSPFDRLLSTYSKKCMQEHLELAAEVLSKASIPTADIRLGWIDSSGAETVKGNIELNPISLTGWIVMPSGSHIIATPRFASIDNNCFNRGDASLGVVMAVRGTTVATGTGDTQELDALLRSLVLDEGILPWLEGDPSTLWHKLAEAVQLGQTDRFSELLESAKNRYSAEGYALISRALAALINLPK